MFLTREEEAMLDGEHGEAAEISMSVLAKLGDIYKAERMTEIENVHIDGGAYGWIDDAGLELVERFNNSGAAFKVPATLNPSSIDFSMWQEFQVPAPVVEKQLRLARAFMKMGACPTWTCTPYQCCTNLRFGQNVAWGESNAVGFANTVIGARTERLGDLADICAAIVGKYPRFGLYLDENRRGQILFKPNRCDVESFSCADYGVLGFLIGSIAEARVPVVDGVPKSVNNDQLKAFCSGAAVGGRVSLSHICGVTPEARTTTEACGGAKPEEKIAIGIDELDEIREKLNTIQGGKPDLICIGCPHCSVEELTKVARAMKGKKIENDIKLLIFTNRTGKALARKMGIIEAIEKTGGKVIADTCWNFIPSEEDILMTDSVKMAWISLRKFNDVILDSTERCIRAAQGKIG